MRQDGQYSRQHKLVEVGDTGQMRIESSTLLYGMDLTHRARDMAVLYGKRAGLQVSDDLSSPSLPSLSGQLQHGFRHAPSRDIAFGAASALVSILSALDIQPSTPLPSSEDE